MNSLIATAVSVINAGIERSIPPITTTIVCPAAAIPRIAVSAKTERIEGSVRKPSIRTAAVTVSSATHAHASTAGARPEAASQRSDGAAPPAARRMPAGCTLMPGPASRRRP